MWKLQIFLKQYFNVFVEKINQVLLKLRKNYTIAKVLKDKSL